jgi:hypothetical protein
VLAPKGRREAQLRGRGICGAQEGGGPTGLKSPES